MNNLKLIEYCLCCNKRRFDCENLDAGKYGGLDYVASVKRNVQDIENKLKKNGDNKTSNRTYDPRATKIDMVCRIELGNDNHALDDLVLFADTGVGQAFSLDGIKVSDKVLIKLVEEKIDSKIFDLIIPHEDYENFLTLRAERNNT